LRLKEIGQEAAALMDDDGIHVSKTEARAGTTPHMTRYILPISLGLVVILFLIILLVWR
jgi:hypothetical protein